MDEKIYKLIDYTGHKNALFYKILKDNEIRVKNIDYDICGVLTIHFYSKLSKKEAEYYVDKLKKILKYFNVSRIIEIIVNENAIYINNFTEFICVSFVTNLTEFVENKYKNAEIKWRVTYDYLYDDTERIVKYSYFDTKKEADIFITILDASFRNNKTKPRFLSKSKIKLLHFVINEIDSIEVDENYYDVIWNESYLTEANKIEHNLKKSRVVKESKNRRQVKIKPVIRDMIKKYNLWISGKSAYIIMSGPGFSYETGIYVDKVKTKQDGMYRRIAIKGIKNPEKAIDSIIQDISKAFKNHYKIIDYKLSKNEIIDTYNLILKFKEV